MSTEVQFAAETLVATFRRSTPRGRARQVELMLWALITILVWGGVLIRLSIGDGFPPLVIANSYTEILAGFLTLVFPVAFSLVYGAFPLEILRLRRMSAAERARYLGSNAVDLHGALRGRADQPSAGAPTPTVSEVSLSAPTSTDLLASQIDGSRIVASNLYTRSSLYLLVGSMVALSGVLFFYLQSASINLSGSLTTVVVGLVPRFGILFFIEFIAFFFLRQYRAAMDEFRYFEAIKRSREESLFAFTVLDSMNDPPAVVEALRSGLFSSKTPTLAPGQSTEMLETRKVDASELAGLAKIIEGLAAIKK